MLEGVSVPSLICMVLGGFLAVLGRFLSPPDLPFLIFWKICKFRKRILMFFESFSQLIAFSVSGRIQLIFCCRQCNLLAQKLTGEVRGG